MCAKGQSMSASGRAFHATWCVTVAAPTGECASATRAQASAATPAPKRETRHDCEAAHAGVGHVRWAITSKRAAVAPVASAPTPTRTPRRTGRRNARAQARANACSPHPRGLEARPSGSREWEVSPTRKLVMRVRSRGSPTHACEGCLPDQLAHEVLAHVLRLRRHPGTRTRPRRLVVVATRRRAHVRATSAHGPASRLAQALERGPRIRRHADRF